MLQACPLQSRRQPPSHHLEVAPTKAELIQQHPKAGAEAPAAVSAAPLEWGAAREEKERAAAAQQAEPVLKLTLRTSSGRLLLQAGQMVLERD